ncbi:MAG: hypothetical protein KBD83_06750 [Gammaproteobacteria bacterium]|nr:hypothetical protein [Gammaproteobacteria bacterium]
MYDKKIIYIFTLAILGAFSVNVFANQKSEATVTEWLNRFTISDINQIYQSCGDENSNAAVCATTFNKIVQSHFRDVKPINSADVDLFWNSCAINGDDKMCAQNINSILKTHVPNAKSTVSESDVQQIKSLNLISSNGFLIE